MNLQLVKATIEFKPVISGLMQFYMYDFSEYTKQDVGPNGLFGTYLYLDDYWIEENRFPYIIKLDDQLIGFVFVKEIEGEEKKYFSMAEFFILRKYRRREFGNRMAKDVFDLHRGNWEVYQIEANKPAQSFWRLVISDYTKGQFTERIEASRLIQEFNNDFARQAD